MIGLILELKANNIWYQPDPPNTKMRSDLSWCPSRLVNPPGFTPCQTHCGVTHSSLCVRSKVTYGMPTGCDIMNTKSHVDCGRALKSLDCSALSVSSRDQCSQLLLTSADTLDGFLPLQTVCFTLFPYLTHLFPRVSHIYVIFSSLGSCWCGWCFSHWLLLTEKHKFCYIFGRRKYLPLCNESSFNLSVFH